jgi:SAM-dependent methyltransferase
MPRQRRSLSMPRTPGRIHRDGLTATATVLVEALTAAQTDRETAETLTHPFHAYPARLHPATAKVLVEFVGAGAAQAQPLVDPFCGSGTVLVEARALGLRAIGVDLNPLAVLIARAKTWTVPPRRRTELREAAHAIAGDAIAAGKAARRSGAEQVRLRGPAGFDPNARNRRLARWFAPHVRRELEHIAHEIDAVHARDAELADVLLACLSAVLYKVSSRASDTDPTWVERHVGRGAAARLFAQRADLLAAGLADLSRHHGSPCEVRELDARRLAEVVRDGGACGIVTSPPYAGTYDYAEHQRLRFDFLGLRHRALDEGELGPRRAFEADAPAAYATWRAALAHAIAGIARALAPGRAAALVVGDSVARGRALYALDDLRDALTSDLVLEAWASQERPMLGAAERRAFGDRPKAEHVVVLRRTAS